MWISLFDDVKQTLKDYVFNNSKCEHYVETCTTWFLRFLVETEICEISVILKWSYDYSKLFTGWSFAYFRRTFPQDADNAVLYRPIYSVQDELNLQTDLDAIRTWSTINKFPLNAAKCVVMHITRSHKLSHFCQLSHGWYSSWNNFYPHLGIVLSSNLEWGPHVDEVTSKAKPLLGFIRRTVGSNDPVTMKKLIVALVRPIIEYCAPLYWAPNRESHKHKLEGVQRSCTRRCYPGPWHSRPSYGFFQAPDSWYSHHYFPLWLSSYHVCCLVFVGQVWY